MPIVGVEVVGRGGGRRRSVASRRAEAVGRALGAPGGHAWVRLRRLPTSDSAESGGGPPRGVRPVFVTVLRQRPPWGRARAREVLRVTAAVATVLDRPREDVHVLYRADARGRAAFGGRLLGR